MKTSRSVVMDTKGRTVKSVSRVVLSVISDCAISYDLSPFCFFNSFHLILLYQYLLNGLSLLKCVVAD